jgi:hypothetical protein
MRSDSSPADPPAPTIRIIAKHRDKQQRPVDDEGFSSGQASSGQDATDDCVGAPPLGEHLLKVTDIVTLLTANLDAGPQNAFPFGPPANPFEVCAQRDQRRTLEQAPGRSCLKHIAQYPLLLAPRASRSKDSRNEEERESTILRSTHKRVIALFIQQLSRDGTRMVEMSRRDQRGDQPTNGQKRQVRNYAKLFRQPFCAHLFSR